LNAAIFERLLFQPTLTFDIWYQTATVVLNNEFDCFSAAFAAKLETST
jgi:hypothetical protein